MKTFLDLSYNSLDDLCKLDVYLPDQCNGKVYIYFHGGALRFGDKGDAYVAKMASVLESSGIALVSANYRLAPAVEFPVFVEDAAQAVAWVMTEGKSKWDFSEFYIGGSSAGSYLSSMLTFDPKYLGKYNIDALEDIAGYVFDAGQPTTHYTIVSMRGEDKRKVLLDEAAPLFFIDHPFDTTKHLPRILNIIAENDLVNRPEQNALTLTTMRDFEYPADLIVDAKMLGFGHCGYMSYDGYHKLTRDFISGGISTGYQIQVPYFKTEE